MRRVLLAWLGNTDLGASQGDPKAGQGPIAQAVLAREFDELVLLADHKPSIAEPYVTWLRAKTKAGVRLRPVTLSSPTHYGEIYRAATEVTAWALVEFGKNAKLTFHLSPGTPAMAVIWVIVAKTRFDAELIESSAKAGVRTADVPFELAAELIPSAVRRSEEELEKLGEGFRPEFAEFADIKHRSASMKRLVAKAEQAAHYNVPVLIQGESGTGKELLARAIHRAGPRAEGPFVAVNCGAIPRELVESEFFGHRKGAFTGADRDRVGHFEAANGGTLFLDEVGELSSDAQVRLLRVLQEKQVVRVGESKARPVDVRVISATNRDLLEEVGQGRFRDDLFFRLAILVLHIPSLREREGDVGLIVDGFLARLNAEAGKGGAQKRLSPAARSLLLRHSWPGNVRELEGTLWRAFVWTAGPLIDAEAVRESLFVGSPMRANAVLEHPLGEGFSLEKTIAEVARHYLGRALLEAENNKTQAAKLIGFKSYQRLTQWLEKYGVEA
jgi:transcriptional regulator with PAS, ATPase and Fis domain